MNISQDNGNDSMQDKNIVILSTFQNIEFYNFQDGSLFNGLLIISKDPASFYFRWIPYTSNKFLLLSSSEKEVQLISSIHLFRVVIETSYQHCEVSLYCVDHDEPTIFRTNKNHINFSHQLAQIFTINSVFLNNPNWIRLTQMFVNPPTSETGSIIYYLPCYNGKFSFPVFLNGQIIQKIKKSIEKSNKGSENQSTQSPPPSPTSNNDQINRAGSFKSFFNFSKFSSTMTTKLTITDKSSDNDQYLMNFSQILSKYKIKNINIQLPLSKSDFMLLNSQGVSMNEIKKMIVNQGMDEELRSEMWPFFLSILPKQEKTINLGEVTEYQKILNSRLNEYKSLKFQWSSLSEYQLVESKELRSAFYTIKMDVKRTSIPNELISHLSNNNNDEMNIKKASFLFKKVLKNILKTFSIWNYRIRYTQGINEIAVPFVCVALYGIINTVVSKSEQNIGLSEFINKDSGFGDSFSNIKKSFDNLSSNLIDLIDEKEAIAFWCFVSFMEKSQNVLLELSMTNLIEIDLPEILEIVKKQSQRDVFKFIKQYQLDSLNFLVSPFMLLFRRSFNESKVERLWDSIIVIEDFNNKYGNSGAYSSLIRKKNFELAFAASVLIFVVPILKKKLANSQLSTNEAINEMILLEMPELIENLPIEYVIRVALSIENDLNVKTQTRIVVDCKNNLDEIEFFSPSMLSETNEYSKLGLFC